MGPVRATPPKTAKTAPTAQGGVGGPPRAGAQGQGKSTTQTPYDVWGMLGPKCGLGTPSDATYGAGAPHTRKTRASGQSERARTHGLGTVQGKKQLCVVWGGIMEPLDSWGPHPTSSRAPYLGRIGPGGVHAPSVTVYVLLATKSGVCWCHAGAWGAVSPQARLEGGGAKGGHVAGGQAPRTWGGKRGRGRTSPSPLCPARAQDTYLRNLF